MHFIKNTATFIAMLLRKVRLKHITLFITIIAAVLIMRVSIINIASISSGSMLPNYQVHSYIITNQLAWGLNLPFVEKEIIQWAKPKRGDVVLFKNPHDAGKTWMKRVIALPGDQVKFYHHTLYVNGIACSYIRHHKEHLPRNNASFSASYKLWYSYLEKDWGPIDVPAGAFFLMGDNRGDSLDSRSWGTISMSYLIGKPILRIWPLTDIAWLGD